MFCSVVMAKDVDVTVHVTHSTLQGDMLGSGVKLTAHLHFNRFSGLEVGYGRYGQGHSDLQHYDDDEVDYVKADYRAPYIGAVIKAPIKDDAYLYFRAGVAQPVVRGSYTAVSRNGESYSGTNTKREEYVVKAIGVGLSWMLTKTTMLTAGYEFIDNDQKLHSFSVGYGLRF